MSNLVLQPLFDYYEAMTRSAWAFTTTTLLFWACSPAAPAPRTSQHREQSPITATNPLLAVRRTAGCGVAPTQQLGTFVKHSLVTSGTKAHDCAAKDSDGKPVCGPWTVAREYAVSLPAGYDPNRAYPLVLQGPGCGGSATDVYTLENAAGPGVGSQVIRVGFTPPPASVGHGTNPNQGCFDDKESDDSVDFAFYEQLLDNLKKELCYDESRVFAVGNSSGSWLANELGCKYAGDMRGHAIRGVIANTGGLPTEPAFRPTCSNAPMAGMWIHEVGDPTNPFSGNLVAINRALVVNGCSSKTYETTPFESYPIGGGNPDSTCKRAQGCPDAYPVVVCALDGNAHAPHDNVVNPAASTYLSQLFNR